MKTFTEFLNESLREIYLDGNALSWNTTKTENEFKDRIRARTGYDYKTFYEIVQKGINTISKQKMFCEEGDACIQFLASKFILIVNKKNKKIITIRDMSWDKPIGENPCKRAPIFEMVFESQEQGRDIVNNVFENRGDFEWGYLDFSEENFGLKVVYNCECCVVVDL
jgi:hypothetical protein